MSSTVIDILLIKSVYKNDKKALEMFNNYFYLDALKSAYDFLDKDRLIDTGIERTICLIKHLDEAIRKDDLISMRRLSNNPEDKIRDFEKAFDNLCEINMEEERQISLFEIMM